MGTYKLLCVFLPSGSTFTFHNVYVTVDNESVLCFECLAASDGLSKRATFPKANIVGWSVTPYPPVLTAPPVSVP